MVLCGFEGVAGRWILTFGRPVCEGHGTGISRPAAIRCAGCRNHRRRHIRHAGGGRTWLCKRVVCLAKTSLACLVLLGNVILTKKVLKKNGPGQGVM